MDAKPSDIAAKAWPGRTGLALVLIVALSLAVRTIIAATSGFTLDEAYIVNAARAPALGYIDHPPLAMWLVSLSGHLFGTEAPLVLRLPSLLLFSGTLWLTARLAARLFSPLAGIYAALTLSLTILFGLYEGGTLVTDGPMLFGLMLGLNGLAAALFADPARTNWRGWLVAGLGLGLALLSKYTAALLLPGLLLFFLTDRHSRRWLLHPAPYLAALVALICLLPPIVWNLMHEGGSFAFQGERGVWSLEPNWARLSRFLWLLAFIILPPVWLGLALTFLDALRRGPRDRARWLLAMLAFAPVLYFPLTWLMSEAGERGLHWASPGYLVLFPLLGAALAAGARRLFWLVNLGVGLVATLTLLVAAYMVTDFTLDWTVGADGKRHAASLKPDVEDWWNLKQALAEKGITDLDAYFIIGAQWEDAARAGIVMGPNYPVMSVEDEPIDMTFTPDPALIAGRDAILIGLHGSTHKLLARLEGHFARFEPLGDLVLGIGPGAVTVRDVHIARAPLKPVR